MAGAPASAAFEIYRETVIGDALCSVLESFVESGKLNEAMAMTILKQFDLVGLGPGSGRLVPMQQ